MALEVVAVWRWSSQRQLGSGSVAAATAVVGQHSKDASGDALEGEAGGGSWLSLSSWGVEYLVKFASRHCGETHQGEGEQRPR